MTRPDPSTEHGKDAVKTGSTGAAWSTARTRALERYLELLIASGNPLANAGEPIASQLRRQFLETVDAAAEPGQRGDAAQAPHLSSAIGQDRAATGIHPSQSLAAATLIFEAALPELAEYLEDQGNLDPLATAAVRLNASILTRMAEAAASYVEYLLDKATTAQQDEARRLSRDLHDVVGPRIAIGLQGLDLAQHYIDSDPLKAQDKIDTSRRSLHDAMTTVRNLAATTRMVIEPGELADALSDHLATLAPSITGAVHNEADLSTLSPHHTNQSFLILREAIRNAAKHGEPNEITVVLELNGPNLIATVCDDGQGFDPDTLDSDGSGMASMKERAALIGADLSITSRPGHTAVTLSVPLPWQEQA